MRIIILFSVLIFLLNNIFLAQTSRTNAMGGLSYSIIDKDASFDLFDFGNNPAWLVKNETKMQLDISPSMSNSWGNYRRIYAPEGIMNYSAGFEGIKPLESSGTFKAKAIYDYEMRRLTYRTLKRDTYAGEAFFFTDTTSGDIKYNGPTFEFMHSLELFNKFYVGASIQYKISNGLKKVYTYAQTLYRDVSGQFGIAYQILDNLTLGSTIELNNIQERIEASDVNLFSVITYHFRGETYAVELRGTTQDYKLKKKKNKFGLQLHWQPLNDLELGIRGFYFASSTSVLFPQGGIIDNEDGFANFTGIDLQLRARYKLAEGFIIGLKSGYIKDDSWSKNSKRDLLLWEWDLKTITFGLGSSYYIDPLSLLLGLEYEISTINADSSKYIDGRNSTNDSFDHSVRFGLEYNIIPHLFTRAGYNLEMIERDFIYGGKDVIINSFSFGAGYQISESIIVEPRLEYSKCTGKKISKLNRSRWGGFITLRLFTF